MAQANHPDYEKAKAKCIVFLQNFLLDEDNITPPKYIEQLVSAEVVCMKV